MRKSKYTLLYYIGLLAVLLCISCDSKTVYSHYQSVALAGWEKNDVISFGTAPLEQQGTYQEKIGIRINGAFPFMALTLIIDQKVFPTLETHCDTLSCELINEDGNIMGEGISHYQYTFPLKTLVLQKNDSLSIHIRHDMKREILPGVSDIGIILEKE
ncbi:MAG: gliding motility lipoprotein GldH [Prevotella sp.]|nr:gliding motility lipoprotein GldH [Prevotella sp.]